jgi:hypothetical protein
MLTIDEHRERWLSFNVREDALRGLIIGAQVQVSSAAAGGPKKGRRHGACAARGVRGTEAFFAFFGHSNSVA